MGRLVLESFLIPCIDCFVLVAAGCCCCCCCSLSLSLCSSGHALLQQMDIDSDEDNVDVNAVKAPSVVKREKDAAVLLEMESLGFGGILEGLESGGNAGFNTSMPSPTATSSGPLHTLGRTGNR